MEKIKVCYVIDSLSGGGAESQLIELVKGIDRGRYSPTVCCLSSDSPISKRAEEIMPDITFYHMDNLFTIAGLREWLRFIKFVRKSQFDIVHSYLFTADIVGVLGSFIARQGVRISSRRDLGFWHKWRHRWLYRYLLNPLTHHFNPNASATEAKLVEREHVSPAHVTTIMNGVDIYKFSSNRHHQMKNGPGAKGPVFGIVASLSPVKGHAILFEAMSEVLQEEPLAKLLIAGSGPLDGWLHRIVERSGLLEAVEFLGYRPDVESVYRKIDILVSASHSEATSNTIMEAMACGLPVVATGVGASLELIEDGRTGYLCEPGDAESMADQMLRAWRGLQAGAGVGQLARMKIVNHYSNALMVARTEALYGLLTGSHRT